MSDTLERMLRPQGLFQGKQPLAFDWQQAYAPQQQPAQPQPAQPQAPQGPGGPGYQPGQYGQPPYPGGEYGATEWGAAYGAGQYPPTDFGTAQYAQGQFGQPPYPPGQYPPGGQYGPGAPGAPYGPGGQFGPGVPPEGDGRRTLTFGKLRLNMPKNPLIPAVGAAALVVIVVMAVVFAMQNGAPPAAAGTPGGSTSTGTSAALAREESQAAAQLSGLLAQSGNDRSDVEAAAGNVEACKDLAASAREFSKAATNRHTLLTKLTQLPDRSALPTALVSDLTGAWQASATVDRDLAKWATKAATSGCHKGNSKDPNLNASLYYDGVATGDKTAFVRLWNPLARKDSLPTYTVDQL